MSELNGKERHFGTTTVLACCLALVDAARASSVWVEREKLTALDVKGGKSLGFSVHMSGEYAAVGGNGKNERTG